MAWDDEYDVPDTWSQQESHMFDDLINGDPTLGSDQTLQLLFDVALFQDGFTPRERDGVQAALEEYLWDEYGIDFDDAFDWAAYREWYESA